MGMEYNFSAKLSLNLEPTFRYYMNTFSNGAVQISIPIHSESSPAFHTSSESCLLSHSPVCDRNLLQFSTALIPVNCYLTIVKLLFRLKNVTFAVIF